MLFVCVLRQMIEHNTRVINCPLILQVESTHRSTERAFDGSKFTGIHLSSIQALSPDSKTSSGTLKLVHLNILFVALLLSN